MHSTNLVVRTIITVSSAAAAASTFPYWLGTGRCAGQWVVSQGRIYAPTADTVLDIVADELKSRMLTELPRI